MMTDIDDDLRDVAARVERALRTEFSAVRATMSGAVPFAATAPVNARRRARRPALVLVCAATLAVVVAVVLWWGGHHEAGKIDTLEVPPERALAGRYLPTGLPSSAVLESITTSDRSGVRWVRSYRQPGTDRFVVVQTMLQRSTSATSGPGIEQVDLDGVSVTVTVVAGSPSTWIEAQPSCATALVIGRFVERSAALDAARSLRCASDGSVEIDTPAGFEKVYDGPDPWVALKAGTNLTYRIGPTRESPRPRWVDLRIAAGVDTEHLWLTDGNPSTIERVTRGDRTYTIVGSKYGEGTGGEVTTETRYAVSFVEQGTYVSTWIQPGTREEVLALAESIQPVGDAEHQAVVDQLAFESRKPAYFVADHVLDGFVVTATESRDAARMSMMRIESGLPMRGYSVSWGDFAVSPSETIVATTDVGGRQVEIITSQMAVPPVDATQSAIMFGRRSLRWQERPGMVVVVSTMTQSVAGGPEDAEMLAIIAGLRRVDEAEWKAYLAAHQAN